MSKLLKYKRSNSRLEDRIRDYENNLVKGSTKPQQYKRPGSQKK